jgi:pimeloyl-ACP methyl ester carboxylesterase
VGALTLSALEWGPPGAPGLLFIHGGAAHVHWFDRVAPAFADRFHVVALDQRGHGESGWASPPAYATQDFTDDLQAVMEPLGWARMTLVGHSMGGHNAMAFGAWHPERLDALAIVDSRPAVPLERMARMHERGLRPPRRHPSLEAAAATFRLLPPETVADPALLAHLAQSSYVERTPDADGGPGWGLRFDPACYAVRRPVDAWPLLPAVKAPTLILRGEWSPILPRDMAERMQSTVPGAALEEIAGAYHHLVLDRPEAFVTALSRFLAERLAPPA